MQRIEEAVQIWKKLGDISSYPLESKIKRIGGANLHAAAQFDNLKELLKEVNKYNQFNPCFNSPFSF